MRGSIPVDDVDLAILDLLRADGRRPVAEIARLVNLTAAPVKRRIERLEHRGVIEGYTAIVDDAKLGGTVEAFVELRVVGDADVADVVALVQQLDEAQEVITMAGDPDALVRLRVDDAEHLRDVISRLRHSERVVSTRTLMVLGSWRRSASLPRDGAL